MSAKIIFGRAVHGFKQMEVGNIHFGIKQFGVHAEPLQFLRELTQNSIEAIQALPPGSNGHLGWGYSQKIFDQTGVKKLSITDNGIGMTGPDMVRLINKVYASGKTQSLDGNFGVGAKITTIPKSPAGVIYKSWRDGVGSMIVAAYDAEEDKFGLHKFMGDDGELKDYLILDENDPPPSMINEGHGTQVILLGNDENHQTFFGLDNEAEKNRRWIIKYLNEKYLSFPENVRVFVRHDELKNDELVTTHTEVKGQHENLDRSAEHKGTVNLSNADVHWWILKEKVAAGAGGGIFDATGHVAISYNGELYEKHKTAAAYRIMDIFGVIAGCPRVVLYVSPTDEIRADTVRKHLTINGSTPPWDQWGAEFLAQMPSELEAFMQGFKQTSNKDLTALVDEHLKEFMGCFSASAYSDEGEEGFVIERKEGKPRKPSSENTERKLPKKIRRKIAEGDELSGLSIPSREWVSLTAGSKYGVRYSVDDGLEDRAALYIPSCNLIKINADFRGFRDFVKSVEREYRGNKKAAPEIIEGAATAQYELALTQAVIIAKIWFKTGVWTKEEQDKALSTEALTTTTAQRIAMIKAAKQEISHTIMRLRNMSEQTPLVANEL